VVERVQWIIGGAIFTPPLTMDRITITEESVVFFPVDVVDSTVFRCDVQFSTESAYRPGGQFELTVEDLPPFEVELTAPFNGTAGDEFTVWCSVTDVPHLVTLPRLELIEAGDLEANITDTLLANRTGYRVSETFNPLTTMDAGQQYFCRAQLEIESVDVYLRSQSDPYTVTVQIPSPDVTISAVPGRDVFEGSTFTLTCLATLSPHVNTPTEVSFMWAVPGQLTGEEPVIQTADSGPLVHSSNLTLANAKRDAGGLYTCTVSVRGGDHVLDISVAQTITPRVLGQPPVFITGPNNANGGGSATFGCRVELSAQPLLGSPPIVKLMREGETEPLVTSSTLSISYTLSPVLASQAGAYFCELEVEGLSESLRISELHKFTVLVPSPTFALSSSPPNNMNISLGSTVVLICEVTIDPSYDVVESANVTWVGPRLSSSREGFTITQSTSGLSCYTSRLTISEVVGEDAGDYSCGLSSIGGNQYVVTTSTTSFIPLRVFDPPPMLVLSSSIPEEEVARGSSVVLTCVATFSSQLDSVKLTWGGPQTISTIDESKHKIVEANSGLTYSSSLTVLDVKGEDEGVYVCTLSGVDKNGLQVTSDSSIAISVAEPSNSGAGIQRSGLSLIITGIIALFLFA
jgi:hypothetical protein